MQAFCGNISENGISHKKQWADKWFLQRNSEQLTISGQIAKNHKFVLDFHRIPEIIVQVDKKPKVLEFQKESNCK